MKGIETHLAAWGCPATYCRDFEGGVVFEFREATDKISQIANWYPEEDHALAEMIREGDSAAIRAWSWDSLYEIALETGGGDEEGAQEYADRVIALLEELADQVEKSQDE